MKNCDPREMTCQGFYEYELSRIDRIGKNLRHETQFRAHKFLRALGMKLCWVTGTFTFVRLGDGQRVPYCRALSRLVNWARQ